MFFPTRTVIFLALIAGVLVSAPLLHAAGPSFSVSFPKSRNEKPLDGRIFLLLSTDPSAEPRMQIDDSVRTQMMFGMDVDGMKPGQTVVVDDSANGYPIRSLRDVPAGEYYVQAVLHRYETFHRSDGHTVKLPMDRGEGQHWNIAPGNLYSTPQKIKLGPATGPIAIVLDQAIPPIPPEVRAKAAALYGELGGERFRAELARLDPESAALLPSGDRQRLIRAFEIVRATGIPIGAWQRRKPDQAPYRFASILLMPPREALYAACDARFLRMIEAGALGEAAALAARALAPDLPAMKGVGVPELLRHLRGDISLDEAIALAMRETRRYAKRQTTWFRHQMAAGLRLNEQYSESLLRCSCHFVDQLLLTG